MILLSILKIIWILLVVFFRTIVWMMWRTPGILWVFLGFLLYGVYLEMTDREAIKQKNLPKTWEEQRLQVLQDCERYADLYQKARKELEKFDRLVEAKKEMRRKQSEWRRAAIEYDRIVASTSD